MRSPGGPLVTLSCKAPSAGSVVDHSMGGVRIVTMDEIKVNHKGSDRLTRAMPIHTHTMARFSDVSSMPHPVCKT